MTVTISTEAESFVHEAGADIGRWGDNLIVVFDRDGRKIAGYASKLVTGFTNDTVAASTPETPAEAAPAA